MPIAAETNQGYPVLIMNPGGESSRASCLLLGETLAAGGYVIFALEGVRDSPAQVFPDGEMITMPLRKGEAYTTPRIADMRYPLDQLPRMNTEGLSQGNSI